MREKIQSLRKPHANQHEGVDDRKGEWEEIVVALGNKFADFIDEQADAHAAGHRADWKHIGVGKQQHENDRSEQQNASP